MKIFTEKIGGKYCPSFKHGNQTFHPDGYMADIRHELTICPECDGDGWYADHDPTDPHINGCSNCPIQVQCEKCEATGLVYKADLEREKKVKALQEDSDWDMPF